MPETGNELGILLRRHHWKKSAIQKVLEQVAIVAPTGPTVLLHGETGTGKELIARAIHKLSPGASADVRPHELRRYSLRPAGERAVRTREGRVHRSRNAEEGADSNWRMAARSSSMRSATSAWNCSQNSYGRCRSRSSRRLGSTRTIQVDVRMIAATHRDLSAMMRDQKFREDLFYRLNVFPIEIPPLRKRPGDIPILVKYFVSKVASACGSMSDRFLSMRCRH